MIVFLHTTSRDIIIDKSPALYDGTKRMCYTVFDLWQSSHCTYSFCSSKKNAAEIVEIIVTMAMKL